MNKVRTGVAAAYLCLSIVLGGASAAGAFANALLQVLAAIVLAVHFWSRGAPPLPREGRWLVAIFLAFAAVGLAQLIPLSPSIWTALPGRDVVVESLRLLGLQPGDMPASLDPRRTLASLLWLLPPAAMFLVTTRLTRDERSLLAKVLIGAAIVSIVLGAFQILGGGGSSLRFYEITNPTSSVGFFANANHMATLMLSALPFAVLFMARAKKERSGSGSSKGKGQGFIYGAIAAFVAVGVMMNNSVAGYGLLIPTAAASYFLYRKSVASRIGTRNLLAAGAVAALIVAASTLGPLSPQRLGAKLGEGSTTGRDISIPLTIAAMKDHFPYGSGLGTFRDLYRTYEPTESVTFVYVNHAHNDYTELALELGLPGVLLILAFVLWWATRSVGAWRSDYHGVALARAGSIVLGIMLLHSLVDYPLRTSALAAVAALAAGLMIPAPVGQSRRSGAGPGKRKSKARHIDADAP